VVTKGYEPLAVGDQTIAAAYLAQTLGTPRGAVLLLHDINEHIDSATIGILRRQLPSHGWNTLAIKIIRFKEDSEPDEPATETAEAQPEAEETAEPPVPEPENTPTETPEAAPTETAESTEPAEQAYTPITTSQRIDAALLKLQQEGHEYIVLIGQGSGGELALQTLKATAVPVSALIMINTGELASDNSITDTNIPVLEILGSRQKDSVKQAVLKRQVQMKTEQKTNYHLREINGANHYFSSVPQQLTNQVHGWLYKQFFAEKDAP
jgi:dienelactone hydrolase